MMDDGGHGRKGSKKEHMLGDMVLMMAGGKHGNKREAPAKTPPMKPHKMKKRR